MAHNICTLLVGQVGFGSVGLVGLVWLVGLVGSIGLVGLVRSVGLVGFLEIVWIVGLVINVHMPCVTWQQALVRLQPLLLILLLCT